MEYRSIHCDSIIKRIVNTDSLFHGDYCIDPYQNCEFGCLYCDSSFEKIIYIKKNIIDILRNELASIENGRIIIGSVHDPYQPAEERFQLTKQVLELLTDYDFSCHILTKSPLILRDIDLITQLHSLVTISLLSLNDKVVRIFEPMVASSKERLQIIQTLHTNTITAGVAFIPVLPYITDSEVDSIVLAARNNHAHYLIHKPLELKGDQALHYKKLIDHNYPALRPRYDLLYKNTIKPEESYIKELNVNVLKNCEKYDIPNEVIL